MSSSSASPSEKKTCSQWLCTATWPGKKEFFSGQLQIACVLLTAWLGNNWPHSYRRNDNHNPTMFWVMMSILGVATIASWKHIPNPNRVTLLSRAQTDEWKGWMQCAFIMYHYYRMYSVYNEIRVFVSAYVWMTGFGNFLYFDKKADFSLERVVSMVIRINYFPVLLSVCLGVPMELYYVVPLHTVGFFMTMATCYVAHFLENRGKSYWCSRNTAIIVSLLLHIAFYETKAVDSLLLISKEIHFRFQADKYSAWQGVVGGLLFRKASSFITWVYGGERERVMVKWTQRTMGVFLIWSWWFFFGFNPDKYQYNPVHPYIFFLPVLGFLMVRNSSRYLTECHSEVLELFGHNTLETYVLQFHLLMCQNVQHIPIVIPGSGADGSFVIRLLNMLLCGFIFVGNSVWARKITITTQKTVVELVTNIENCVLNRRNGNNLEEKDSFVDAEEGVEMNSATNQGSS